MLNDAQVVFDRIQMRALNIHAWQSVHCGNGGPEVAMVGVKLAPVHLSSSSNCQAQGPESIEAAGSSLTAT
jgi:hypothetical protein